MINLSVIIPIYNVEKYLKECLDSIIASINQENEEKIEIVLVNDGSTDNSLNICKKYTKEKNYIKLLNKKNGGLSSARNQGIAIAKGKYLSFVDSDDIVSKNYIHNILWMIKKTNFDILLFKYKKFTYKDDIKKQISEDIMPEFCMLKKRNCINKLTIDEVGSFAWNKIYKSTLFKKIRYPQGKYFEDIFTTYKLVDRASVFIESDNVLYYYRQRPGSILHQNNLEKELKIMNDSIEARYKLFLFLSEKGSYKSQMENNRFLFGDCVHLIKTIYVENRGYTYLKKLKFLNHFKFSIKRDGLKYVILLKIYVTNPQLFKYLCRKKG